MCTEPQFIMKELQGEELIAIYSKYSPLHFPADELKPAERIRQLIKDGIYRGYGLFLQNPDKSTALELTGYACLIQLPGHHTMLLDYYAILKEYRSHGIGSIFMKHLKQSNPFVDGIFMETENPDFAANETERAVRNKRNAFYLRNHARFTTMLSTLFGVHYKILYMPFAADYPDTYLHKELQEIYLHMFTRKHYATQVFLSEPL